MKTTELKFNVSGARIVKAEVTADGSCVLTLMLNSEAEQPTSHVQEDIFRLVPASQLKMSDTFMKYVPTEYVEKKFMSEVQKIIQTGVPDFYRPVCDPTFDADGNISYNKGQTPAVGKSYNWWEKSAKKFKPECRSRLGTKTEYIAFLAVLIKELVKSGWQVQDAWHAVCMDSKKLGHYWNSKNAKPVFEKTGERDVCGFCDLANTYKILAEDEEAGGFCLTGGRYGLDSRCFPLARLFYRNRRDNAILNSTGWLVLERSTDH